MDGIIKSSRDVVSVVVVVVPMLGRPWLKGVKKNVGLNCEQYRYTVVKYPYHIVMGGYRQLPRDEAFKL